MLQTMDAAWLRWVALALGIVLNASANILIKAGMLHASGKSLLQVALQPQIVGGVLSFGLALVFYSFSLTKFELSFAYPVMTSLGLTFVFAVSVLAFGEQVTLPKIAGSLLIMAGVVLLTRSN